MNFFLRNWWKILLALIVMSGVAALIAGAMFGFVSLPGKSLKPVPPPKITGKIKGYWSSEGPKVFQELNDIDEMKSIGINTVTFSPALTHSEEGSVKDFPGNETFVKKTINKAHQGGLRVWLETTPMNMGAVSPRVKNQELFTRDMTKMALKYAKIAQEYKVEYFAPIVEPGHHLDDAVADQWLQELLPQLRAVYSGPIAWKKQATDLENPAPQKQDHVLILGFRLAGGNLNIKAKQTKESSLLIGVSGKALQVERYSKNNNALKKQKPVSLDDNWHQLAVKLTGNKVGVSLDSEQILEITDTVGLEGGYGFSGNAVLNKLEIKNQTGKLLRQEKFQNLNGFSAPKGGVTLSSGELTLSDKNEAMLIHDTNFGGYDYIAMDTFHRGHWQTMDEYINFLTYYVNKTNQQAQADGVPSVILAEYGGSLKENIGWHDADERAKIPLTEDELAETVQRVLELAERETDGYIYNGWDAEKQGLKQLPKVREVVSNWYNNH